MDPLQQRHRRLMLRSRLHLGGLRESSRFRSARSGVQNKMDVALFCRWLGWSAFLVSLLGSLCTVLAGLAVGWFAARARTVAPHVSPVSILKPLHGDDPTLRECLESFCRQDYPGAVQIVFGVRDHADPAISVVHKLMHLYPDVEIALVVDPRVWGANLKVSNLVNMASMARHELLVVADSDIGVERGYLRQVVSDLHSPATGFVTCAYVGAPAPNFWSRLSCMATNHHFLPSVALGLRLGWAKPCFGSTMAFRKEVLDAVGGFLPFANMLADDFEIGRAILGLGYGFVVSPVIVRHRCSEASGQSLLRHELRWASTIQVINPISYAASTVCHPLPAALAAACLLHWNEAALASLALVVASRLFVVTRVKRVVGGDVGLWWLSPARDMVSAFIHVCGFLVRTVEWQGRRFKLGKGGRLLGPVASCEVASRSGHKPRLSRLIMSQPDAD